MQNPPDPEPDLNAPDNTATSDVPDRDPLQKPVAAKSAFDISLLITVVLFITCLYLSADTLRDLKSQARQIPVKMTEQILPPLCNEVCSSLQQPFVDKAISIANSVEFNFFDGDSMRSARESMTTLLIEASQHVSQLSPDKARITPLPETLMAAFVNFHIHPARAGQQVLNTYLYLTATVLSFILFNIRIRQ